MVQRSARREIEWPTFIALVAVYIAWAVMLWSHQFLGAWIALPGAFIVAFHASLQHEVLHGHPTRSAIFNEALVFLPIGLVYAYRRFKATHLSHHNDERLTDPYDDPETYYVAEGDWDELSPALRFILRINQTLAGRLTIGPFLAIYGFVRADIRRVRRGEPRIVDAWVRHAIGLVPVIWMIVLAGIPLWFYALLIVVPAVSLLSLRTYIEHRAAAAPGARSAVIESGWFWSLLFLNNNLHKVHHERPGVAWYKLPALWREERERVLRDNDGYFYRGYGAVTRQWLFRPREPNVHPIMRRRP
ncbi:MAG: fatty acid desaturase [Pseudomonadota bacterium]